MVCFSSCLSSRANVRAAAQGTSHQWIEKSRKLPRRERNFRRSKFRPGEADVFVGMCRAAVSQASDQWAFPIVTAVGSRAGDRSTIPSAEIGSGYFQAIKNRVYIFPSLGPQFVPQPRIALQFLSKSVIVCSSIRRQVISRSQGLFAANRQLRGAAFATTRADDRSRGKRPAWCKA